MNPMSTVASEVGGFAGVPGTGTGIELLGIIHIGREALVQFLRGFSRIWQIYCEASRAALSGAVSDYSSAMLLSLPDVFK